MPDIDLSILNYSGEARLMAAALGKLHLTPALQGAPSSGVQSGPNNRYEAYHLEELHRRQKNWNAGFFALDLDALLDNRRSQQVYDFAFAGCFGEGWLTKLKHGWFSAGPQEAIAQSLTRAFSSQQLDANFILGDLIYDAGAEGPNDSRLNYFAGLFERAGPCFVMAGNHDYNLHGNAHWGEKPACMVPNKLYRVMSLVMYSYRHFHTNANNWHMPFRYYCLTSRNIKTHFIVLDSSTFPFDEAQQLWLFELYFHLNQVLPGYRFVMAMHHPFVSYERDRKIEYHGKYRQEPAITRGFNSSDSQNAIPAKAPGQDHPSESPGATKLYADPFCILPAGGTDPINYMPEDIPYSRMPEARNLAQERAFKSNTMGGLIKLFLEIHGIVIDLAIAAHEHGLGALDVVMRYCQNGDRKITYAKRITQYISGGGTRDLSSPPSESFALADFTPADLQELQSAIQEAKTSASSPSAPRIEAKLGEKILAINYAGGDTKYQTLKFKGLETAHLVTFLNNSGKAVLVEKLQLPIAPNDVFLSQSGYMVGKFSAQAFQMTMYQPTGVPMGDIGAAAQHHWALTSYATLDADAMTLTAKLQADAQARAPADMWAGGQPQSRSQGGASHGSRRSRGSQGLPTTLGDDDDARSQEEDPV